MVSAPTEVTTCVLPNCGDVLLVRRGAKLGTLAGAGTPWPGQVETDDPIEDA